MTQNNVDTDFVDGLQLIIDSLIKEGADEDPPKEGPKNFEEWFKGPFGKDSSDEVGEHEESNEIPDNLWYYLYERFLDAEQYFASHQKGPKTTAYVGGC